MSDYNKPRYIFVTGGVCSSLGKGITCASIGTVLESYGFTVSFKKLDGYLNYNAGTMNPEQHGEVYVLDDGSETDLDLGHYNRFTNCELNKNSSITMGSVYMEVINKDINGEYDGDCIQQIPHIVNALKNRILLNNENSDFVIVEIGGTVGDLENMQMIEAIKQIGTSLDSETEEDVRVCYIHLVMIPYIKASEEWKTKPAQSSCKTLMSFGIMPDLILCRVESTLPEKQKNKIRNKISISAGIKESDIIYMEDVKTVYEIPFDHWEDMPNAIFKHFKLKSDVEERVRSTEWVDKVSRINIKVGNKLKVGIFGKYNNVRDSYKSIHESLIHASINLGVELELEYHKDTANFDGNGILIPGGFGYRGIEEKEDAFLYAYYNDVPCLGLCLGLQTAVVSFAKNICKIPDSSYEEFRNERPGKYIVHLMEEQKDVTKRSGTMRLGNYTSIVTEENSEFCKSYLLFGNKTNFIKRNAKGQLFINERHRHRYEINSQYLTLLSEFGMKPVAFSESGLVEAMEICNSSAWFIGTQFHPEYKSKFLNPHPLFISFLNKISGKRNYV